MESSSKWDANKWVEAGQINDPVHSRLLRTRNYPLRKHDQSSFLKLIQENRLPIDDRHLILNLNSRSIPQMLVERVRR